MTVNTAKASHNIHYNIKGIRHQILAVYNQEEEFSPRMKSLWSCVLEFIPQENIRNSLPFGFGTSIDTYSSHHCTNTHVVPWNNNISNLFFFLNLCKAKMTRVCLPCLAMPKRGKREIVEKRNGQMVVDHLQSCEAPWNHLMCRGMLETGDGGRAPDITFPFECSEWSGRLLIRRRQRWITPEAMVPLPPCLHLDFSWIWPHCLSAWCFCCVSRWPCVFSVLPPLFKLIAL